MRSLRDRHQFPFSQGGIDSAPNHRRSPLPQSRMTRIRSILQNILSGNTTLIFSIVNRTKQVSTSGVIRYSDAVPTRLASNGVQSMFLRPTSCLLSLHKPEGWLMDSIGRVTPGDRCLRSSYLTLNSLRGTLWWDRVIGPGSQLSTKRHFSLTGYGARSFVPHTMASITPDTLTPCLAIRESVSTRPSGMPS